MNWTGLAARVWDPSGGDDPQNDYPFIKRLLEQNPGTALDMGCGTGRLLLRYLKDGFDVEGMDTSADMLAILREKAAAQGLKQPTLYQGYMQELDLPRKYQVIYVPCGTYCLVTDRALALDPAWNKGAIHELMISLDSLPEALGGNPARAREHFKMAVAIQKGLSPGPYVALATGIAVPAQDRAEFERLLKDALAIDPEKDPSNRLVILVTQRRARVLLDRIDEKFSK